MPTIDTLRPTANVSAPVDWAANEVCTAPVVSADALWQVLSDDDNDTFAQTGSENVTLVVSCGNHTPAANHERHAIRLRALFLGFTSSSGNHRVQAQQVTTTLVDLTTSIPAGNCLVNSRVPAYVSAGLTAGGTVAYRYTATHVTGAICKLAEAYIDIDTRAKPTFTADVLDGAGVSRAGGIVTDTPTPDLVFDSPTYDGLTARTWRYAVYTLAQTLAGGFDPFVTTPVTEGSGTGTTSNQTLIPLDDDDYVAYMQISSTIRVDDQYDSDIETVAFEVAFTPPPAPDVVVTVTPSPPSVEVCWDPPSPSGGDVPWDDADDVVAEVQRSDCGGEFVTVWVEQTGLSGCWTDRFMPLSNEGVFCDEHQDCAVTYRVRYWGLVDTFLVATNWTTATPVEVDNPTPALPWLRGPVSGDLSICPTESWGRTRPFGTFQPIGGGIPTVVTGAPGGRDYTLVIPTTTLTELATLEAIIAAPLVFYQPPMQADVWLAPATESINVTKVKRIHEVTVPFVAVLAEPLPTPQSFF